MERRTKLILLTILFALGVIVISLSIYDYFASKALAGIGEATGTPVEVEYSIVAILAPYVGAVLIVAAAFLAVNLFLKKGPKGKN